jgi:dihydroxy-acid dehydratase
MIELDVPKRRLHLDVPDSELEKRRKEWKAPPPHDVRGYVKLYCDRVNQADQGVDLDLLVGKSGAAVPGESH